MNKVNKPKWATSVGKRFSLFHFIRSHRARTVGRLHLHEISISTQMWISYNNHFSAYILAAINLFVHPLKTNTSFCCCCCCCSAIWIKSSLFLWLCIMHEWNRQYSTSVLIHLTHFFLLLHLRTRSRMKHSHSHWLTGIYWFWNNKI